MGSRNNCGPHEEHHHTLYTKYYHTRVLTPIHLVLGDKSYSLCSTCSLYIITLSCGPMIRTNILQHTELYTKSGEGRILSYQRLWNIASWFPYEDRALLPRTCVLALIGWFGVIGLSTWLHHEHGSTNPTGTHPLGQDSAHFYITFGTQQSGCQTMWRHASIFPVLKYLTYFELCQTCKKMGPCGKPTRKLYYTNFKFMCHVNTTLHDLSYDFKCYLL